MRPTRRAVRRPQSTAGVKSRRYTVDASVFVNAFNPHEDGHAESLQILAAIQEAGDPIVVPTLLLPEIASAVARASNDPAGAIGYASATAALPQLMLVSLTPAMARQAARLAATHKLRGADSVYVAVARRYGTTLVTRDDEQRSRGAGIVVCQTPERSLRGRRPAKRPWQRRR